MFNVGSQHFTLFLFFSKLIKLLYMFDVAEQEEWEYKSLISSNVTRLIQKVSTISL